jgi:hypothetical protein
MTALRITSTVLVISLLTLLHFPDAANASAEEQSPAPGPSTSASGVSGEPMTVQVPSSDVAGQDVFCSWLPYWIDYALDFHQTGAHGETDCAPATDQQVRTLLQTKRWWGGWETVSQVDWPEEPWLMSQFGYNEPQDPYFTMPAQDGTWRVHQEFWFDVEGNFALRATSTSPEITCTADGCTY